jgi:hypothetical protein
MIRRRVREILATALGFPSDASGWSPAGTTAAGRRATSALASRVVTGRTAIRPMHPKLTRIVSPAGTASVDRTGPSVSGTRRPSTAMVSRRHNCVVGPPQRATAARVTFAVFVDPPHGGSQPRTSTQTLSGSARSPVVENELTW